MNRFSTLVLPFIASALLAAPPALLAPPVQPRPRPAKEPFEDAIDRGLEYLRTQQNTDGSWSNKAGNPWGGQDPFNVRRPNNRPNQFNGDLAITSLAVMAFLSAGHVPGEGHYGANVEKGIAWVLEMQQGDGKLVPNNGLEMYHHGICTLMLAEAIGLTGGDLAEKLRVGLEKAVRVILAGQRNGPNKNYNGGWRYQVIAPGGLGSDADLSVTGWQLLALRSAKNVGCDVPAERINAAVEYVKRSFEPRSGAFQYQPGGSTTIPCTGVGVLGLELSGKEYHLCEESLRGGAYLLKHPMNSGDSHFYYGVYYVAQALFQLGGNYWQGYRPKLHDLLLRRSAPNADGGWLGGGGDGAAFGSSYSTAMAVLALTVEYRFLPIYQRFEEPKERDGRE